MLARLRDARSRRLRVADPVVSKGKARAWCSEWDGITALAPLIGARAARSLQVTRGVEDFPGPVSFEDIDDWDSDSDSDSGYSDSGVNLD